jgi:dihydrofolate reductase
LHRILFRLAVARIVVGSCQRQYRVSAARSTVCSMTRIIYYTATTLSGFIADENNSLDWLFAVDQGGNDDPGEVMARMSVLVEGSTTYQWVLDHEGLLEHPEKWSEFYGDRPTFVFTTRELPVPEGADVRLRRGSVADALPELRAAAGDGDIWVVGGGDLAGQFIDAGALDEIVLAVAPVTLLGGAPVLPRRLESSVFTLQSVERMGQFAKLVYSVSPPAE